MEKREKMQLVMILMLVLAAVIYELVDKGIGEIVMAFSILYISGILEKIWDRVETRLGIGVVSDA